MTYTLQRLLDTMPHSTAPSPTTSSSTSAQSTGSPGFVVQPGSKESSNLSLTSSNLSTQSSGPNQLEYWSSHPERHEWIAYQMQG